VFLTQCGEDSSPSPSATVLVYMNGTDLESGMRGMGGGNGTLNLNEMMRVGSTPDLNIVVQTGGTKEWKTPLVSSANAQRFVVRNGDLDLVENLDQLDIGDPQNLEDFLVWGIQSFPAKHFFVILWDHGAGSVSQAPKKGVFGSDEYTHSALTLPEMVQAFRAAESATGRSFEMIGFDACLMATLEVAEALSPFAKFMVASEQLEPGAGWDYVPWLQRLADEPTVGGETIGRIIADGFLAKITASDQAAAEAGHTLNLAAVVTLSVVDLAHVGEVTDRLGVLASRVAAGLDDESGAILAEARLRSEEYGYGLPMDTVDLNDFAIRLRSSFEPETDGLLAALSRAVLYRVQGSAQPNANGLSVFFPYRRFANRQTLALDLAEFGSFDFLAPAHRALVMDFSTLVLTDTTAPRFSNLTFDAGTLSATVDFSLFPGEVYVGLTQEDPARPRTLFLGLVPIETQPGSVQTFEFTNRWVQLNGHLVSVFASNTELQKHTLRIPARLNGLSVELIAVEDTQTGDFSVSYAWPGVVEGLPSRESFALKQGDVITPLFGVFDISTEHLELVDGQSFMLDGPVNLSSAPLAAGQYHLRFYATDFAQNEGVSDFATVDVP